MQGENVEQLKRLVALLREHPEWQAALRDVLFPEYSPVTVRELLNDLIHQVQSLAEAQRHTEAYIQALADAQKRTEARVAELAEAQKRTEAQVAKLVEAQKRTEVRVDRLENVVAELVEAQKRTEAELAQFRQETREEFKQVWAAIRELTEAQKRLEERVSAEFERVWAAIEELTKNIKRLGDEQSAMRVRLGTLSGWYVESIFRERAPAYLGAKGFFRVRVIPRRHWVKYLEDALEGGRITAEEFEDMLKADALVQARKNGEMVYLAVEVSYTVDEHDVERAVRRTKIWSRLTDASVTPTVAGVIIGEETLKVAKIEDVMVVEIPAEGV